MSARSLATYSLVRALYDQGRDYIDAFWPFLLRVLPLDKRLMPANVIADAVSEQFGLSIPLHTVKTLAERAKRKHGYVKKEHGCYALTDAGVGYVSSSETERDVNRRLHAFIGDAVTFFEKNYPDLAHREAAEKAIRSVVDRNYLLFDYESDLEGIRRLSDGGASQDAAVLQFFAAVESSHPAHFETLHDLILGSTITGLLKRTDISEATRHFADTRFYLDTNFVLSVLGLRYPLECRPAEELLRLINRSASISLAVYDFTLQEVIAVLRGYATESKMYPVIGVRVNSIYASMRSAGYTPASVRELIANLPTELREVGVEQVSTGINLKDIEIPEPDALARLQRYKPDQNERGQLHDLTAIRLIAQERRRDEYRRAEEPEAYLLTEDHRLANYAYLERGHKDRETISEVMPDRLLTNLLWLKNPEMMGDLSVEAAIALHSRDLFIDRRIWRQFYIVVDRLLRDGRVDENAAMLLIYDAQVHKDLAGLGTPGVRQVDEEWALERVEDVRQRSEEQKEWESSQRGKQRDAEYKAELAEVLESHEKVTSSLEARIGEVEDTLRRTQRETGRRRARWEARQKKKAQREASVALWSVKILALVVFVGSVYWAFDSIVDQWGQWRDYEGLVAIGILTILALLGIKWDPLHIHEVLHSWAADGLLARKLAEGDLIFGAEHRAHEPETALANEAIPADVPIVTRGITETVN